MKRQSTGWLIRNGERRRRMGAFTLVELLAVMVILAILVGLTLGIARYASNKAKIARTQTQLEALAMAIEAFKLDKGYYPTSTIYRLSTTFWEVETNSQALLSQLMSGPYIKSNVLMLAKNGESGVTYIADAWGKSVIYYCNNAPTGSTNNVYGAIVGRTVQTNYCTIGGQVNTATFDLFSMGPDQFTYIPNGTSFNFTAAKTNDDIWVGK